MRAHIIVVRQGASTSSSREPRLENTNAIAMHFVVAVLVPPLALWLSGKHLQSAVNAALFILALLCIAPVAAGIFALIGSAHVLLPLVLIGIVFLPLVLLVALVAFSGLFAFAGMLAMLGVTLSIAAVVHACVIIGRVKARPRPASVASSAPNEIWERSGDKGAQESATIRAG